ncbi:MAG: hypothetical protein IJN74_05940 [Clostridia bacterium]|nr:hypothetical protein [Clostridia bacterium]
METTGLKSTKIRNVFAAVIAVLMLAYVVCCSMPFFTYTQIDSKKLSNANAEIDQKISDIKLSISDLEKEIKADPAKAETLTAEVNTLKNELNGVEKFKADWSGENGTYTLNLKEFSAGDVTLSLNEYLWFCYNYPDLARDVFPNIWADAKLPGKYNITSTIGFPLFSFLLAIIGAAVTVLLLKFFWNIGFPVIWSVGTLLGLLTSPVYNLFVPSSVLVLTIISAVVLVLSILYIFLYSIPMCKYAWENRERY